MGNVLVPSNDGEESIDLIITELRSLTKLTQAGLMKFRYRCIGLKFILLDEVNRKKISRLLKSLHRGVLKKVTAAQNSWINIEREVEERIEDYTNQRKSLKALLEQFIFSDNQKDVILEHIFKRLDSIFAEKYLFWADKQSGISSSAERVLINEPEFSPYDVTSLRVVRETLKKYEQIYAGLINCFTQIREQSIFQQLNKLMNLALGFRKNLLIKIMDSNIQDSEKLAYIKRTQLFFDKWDRDESSISESISSLEDYCARNQSSSSDTLDTNHQQNASDAFTDLYFMTGILPEFLKKFITSGENIKKQMLSNYTRLKELKNKWTSEKYFEFSKNGLSVAPETTQLFKRIQLAVDQKLKYCKESVVKCIEKRSEHRERIEKLFDKYLKMYRHTLTERSRKLLIHNGFFELDCFCENASSNILASIENSMMNMLNLTHEELNSLNDIKIFRETILKYSGIYGIIILQVEEQANTLPQLDKLISLAFQFKSQLLTQLRHLDTEHSGQLTLQSILKIEDQSNIYNLSESELTNIMEDFLKMSSEQQRVSLIRKTNDEPDVPSPSSAPTHSTVEEINEPVQSSLQPYHDTNSLQAKEEKKLVTADANEGFSTLNGLRSRDQSINRNDTLDNEGDRFNTVDRPLRSPSLSTAQAYSRPEQVSPSLNAHQQYQTDSQQAGANWDDNFDLLYCTVNRPQGESSPIGLSISKVRSNKDRSLSRASRVSSPGGVTMDENGSTYAAGSHLPTVANVEPGSAADLAGLRPGDLVLETNKQSTNGKSNTAISELINASRTIEFLVRRERKTTEELIKDHVKNIAQEVINDKKVNDLISQSQSRLQQQQPASSSTNSRRSASLHTIPIDAPIVRLCKIRAYEKMLGFTVPGSKNTRGVFKVKKVKPNSPAAHGGLKDKDYIIEINGQNVQNMSNGEVIELLKVKRQEDDLQLLVADPATVNWYRTKRIPISSSMVPKMQYIEELLKRDLDAASLSQNGTLATMSVANTNNNEYQNDNLYSSSSNNQLRSSSTRDIRSTRSISRSVQIHRTIHL